MPRKIRALALSLCIALILVFSLGLVATAAEFSADIKYQGAGADKARPGKFYIKGNMMRQELTIASQGQMQMILNLKTRQVTTIIPQAKMYTQGVAPVPTEDSKHMMWESAEKSLPKGAKKVGTETVSGYKCDVYQYKDSSKGRESKLWVSSKLNFPIKIETKGSRGPFTMMMTNIKEGGVSDSLFKPPAGFRKMNIPAGAMGGGKR